MRSEEAGAVNRLVVHVFRDFVARDYTAEGITDILEFIAPGNLSRRAKAGSLILVAEVHNSIVGMLELQKNRHLALLFVDSNHQGQGIAGHLLRRSLERMRTTDPHLAEISVQASPYALEFYRKIGFRETGPQRHEEGRCYHPMTLDVDTFLASHDAEHSASTRNKTERS